MNKLRKATSKKIIVPAVCIIIGAFSLGLVSFKSSYDFKIVKNLEVFYSVFKNVTLYYVDKTNPQELIEKGINGMLESLDPYTKYIPESDLKDFKFQTTGEYGGIGALIQKKNEYAIISRPYKGFPAHKSGLKAGDKIIEVDNQSIKDKSLEEISDLLKGTPGSQFEITIERYNESKPITRTITREAVKIDNVRFADEISEDIGYIRLTGFKKGAAEETRNVFTELLDKEDVKTLVLDLRDNPGGLLSEAVGVTNLFVPKGTKVVETKGRLEKWEQVYKAENDPVNTAIKIVVLVNNNSASASEIVAGALQDLDRAVVIGQQTYGKGLVQTSKNLSYNNKIKITTARYHIPSGRCIQSLDFSQDNSNGTVRHVPDSLMKKYKTKNGRTVYSGKGIIPDIETERVNYSKISMNLVRQDVIFDFATRFYYEHDTIPSVNEYEVSSDTYNNFISYVKQKDFDYTTKSEENLQDLIDAAEKENYYDECEKEFKALKEKISHNKAQDLHTFKDEITELMEQEIVSRYFLQEGNVRASLEQDRQVDSAIHILNNKERYKAILTPVNATDSTNHAEK